MTVDELYAIARDTLVKHEKLESVNKKTMNLINVVVRMTHPSNVMRNNVDPDAIVADYTPLYLDRVTAIEYRADQINTDPFQIAALSLAKCVLTANPTTIPMAGESLITLEVRDVNGRLFPHGGHVVALQTDLGVLTEVLDEADGTYRATFTSAFQAGTATITATIGGQAVTDNAQVIVT